MKIVNLVQNLDKGKCFKLSNYNLIIKNFETDDKSPERFEMSF